MRKAADPFFPARETRSTRRNAREPGEASESSPADVGPADLTQNGAKRKGKGKSTEALRKKPHLASSYLDPFTETLVPEPSLTPAQSDALSLLLHTSNLPQPHFDDLNLDPQLSRMGQAALSATTEVEQSGTESSGHGLPSPSDNPVHRKNDSSPFDSPPSGFLLSSEKRLCMSPSLLGPTNTGLMEPDMIPAAPPLRTARREFVLSAIPTGASSRASSAAPAHSSPALPLRTPRREFLIPAMPTGGSSRASSVAPARSFTPSRNSKVARPDFSFTGSPHSEATRSFSLTPSRPSSRSLTTAPAHSLHPQQPRLDHMTKTSQKSATKKFTFLALPPKPPGLQNLTPTPRRIDSSSLSIDIQLSPKPSISSRLNLSLSDLSVLSHSDGSPPIADIAHPEPNPTTSGPLTTQRSSIPKLVSDKIASLENTVSNLQRDFAALAVTNRGLLRDHQILLKECSTLETKLHIIEERTATLEDDMGEIERSVSANSKGLTKLEDIFEDLNIGDARPMGSKNNVKKALKPTAVRKVLLRVMQTEAKDVKFLEPLEGGEFILADPETDDGVILRPNFEISWLDNSSWHDNVVKFVRKKAPVYTPAFTEQMMNGKTNADILERIATNFKGWAAAYSKQKRKAEAGVTDDPTNRRKGRKVRKCSQREVVRSVVKMEGPEWDFFFQPAYQSTDETDDGNNMDPDSESESVLSSIPRLDTKICRPASMA